MRRFLARLGWIALLGTMGSSCLSPTLPLPPPDIDSVTQTDDGLWQVAGTCKPGAMVTVLNDETGTGVVFEDREQIGQWVVQLPGDLCDAAWVSQEFGNDESSRTNFVIDEINIDQPSGSGACN
ncbi:MAG: hypothetical protein IPK82_11845 [Polyangiaceae bacterium]|nr:hypothetical protein [Polyangiaceae bacterium]